MAQAITQRELRNDSGEIMRRLDAEHLPIESAVSAITMAELAVFDPLPFDSEASRACGRVYAAVVGAGRKDRGARAVDLLIAATACSAGLPLYTRNPADFHALHELVEVVQV